MKLLEIDIENYGVFTGRRLELGGGLHLIYGPNEAGKSTLLQLIRELLFGFPHSSRYVFTSHQGEMAATVRAELDDGRRLRFRRRKGRNNPVVGEFDGGQTVDSAVLERLLGNATAPLYDHVFGFSLDELSSGEKSLSQANLSEALFGGGMGGLANFQQVQEQIAKQRDELFLSSPNAKRKINNLLSQIRALNGELSELAVSPREYTELRQKHDALSVRMAQLREKLESARARRRRLERLRQAVGVWSQLRAVRSELQELDAPQTLASNALEQFEQIEQQLREIDDQAGQIELEIAENAEARQSLKLSPEVMCQEPDIRLLNQQIGQMKGFIEDLPKRRDDKDRLLDDIVKQLASLDPSWTLDHLHRYEAGVAQMGQVKEMAEQAARLESQRQTLLARRPDLADEIAQLESQLAQLPERTDLPLLEELSEQVSAYQQTRKGRAEVLRKLSATQDEVARLRRQLAAGIQFERDDFENQVVPRQSAVEQACREFQALATECERLARSQRELQEEIDQRRQELDRLQAERSVPDRQTLLDYRQRRDVLWTQLRRCYIEGEQTDGEVPSADRYEEMVESADRVADERQAHAEIVAKKDQLQSRIEQTQQRLAEIGRQQELLDQRRRSLMEDWRNQWKPAGIVPGSPDQMREWLLDHQRLLDAVQRLADQQNQLADIDDQLAEFESTLSSALGEGGGAGAESLARLKHRVAAAREAEAKRKQCQGELPQLHRRLAKLDADVEQVEQQQRDWKIRWERMLEGFGFPAAWSAELAREILSGLAQARAQYGQVQSLEQRISDMEAGLAEFEARRRQVCLAVDPMLAQLPCVDAVLELGRLLEQGKQAAQRQVDLAAQEKSLQRRQAAVLEQGRQRRRARSELLQAAGASDEQEFREIAWRARRRAKLMEEAHGLERELRVIRETDDPTEFEASLQDTNVDELEIQLSESADEVAKCEAELQDLARADGETSEKLRRFDTRIESVVKASELESQRAALREALDQWAPLVFAQALMNRVIQKFEREHQPAMLQDVASLFRRMTNDRYLRIHRRLDGAGTLLVEQADGERKEPNMLSTGTREQLYLAIRLAYIRHYCREGESLPIVMDDVLVNFDDERAQSTLETLAEFAEQIQILFLTCHQSTLQKVQQCQPDASITVLEPLGVAESVGGRA